MLVVFGVWLLDYKLKIDDPVGAVAVHMMNGIWGTFAVGLFATKSAPGFQIALDGLSLIHILQRLRDLPNLTKTLIRLL